MCQQIRIDAIQLTRLVKSLLADPQKRLNLPVQTSNVRQQLCWGTLAMSLGERRCRLREMVDAVVTDIGQAHPGSQASRVVFGRRRPTGSQARTGALGVSG